MKSGLLDGTLTYAQALQIVRNANHIMTKVQALRSAPPCEVCGGPAPAAERCTNGRCSKCHTTHCTPGGQTTPGHGRKTDVKSMVPAVKQKRTTYGESVHDLAAEFCSDDANHADQVDTLAQLIQDTIESHLDYIDALVECPRCGHKRFDDAQHVRRCVRCDYAEHK